MRPLVLASTSPYRRALMQRLGLDFTPHAPDFPEVAPPDASPAEVARSFAAGKARSLAAAHPGALIIGSDQVLEIDGRRLSKPPDLKGAVAQLLELSGRRHALHTGVAVLDAASGRLEEELVRVELVMRPLTRAQAERYVAVDQPHGCVGGYTFEGRGICLFELVEGPCDESAIVGLPLLAVCRLLRRQGLEPLEQW